MTTNKFENNHEMDIMFMKMTYLFAQRSHCKSFKVAAIAVRDGRILFTGINGTPHGYLNCDEMFEGTALKNPEAPDWQQKHWREEHHKWSLIHEAHAEQNLIGGACRNCISLEGATVYLPMQPCQDCLKLMIVSGIKEIVFVDYYDKVDQETLVFAKECGINIRRLENFNEQM